LVFISLLNLGGRLKYSLLKILCCPVCRASNFVLETKKINRKAIWNSQFRLDEINQEGVDVDELLEREVQEGALHCDSCGRIYPILEGVPRMLTEESTDNRQSGHRTTTFKGPSSVWEDNFMELSSPLRKDDFLGKVVLDVGCGYGRHAYFAALCGAEVIAIDNSTDAVLSTKRNTNHLQNVHVIQADGANLPLRDESVDRVYSYGVLHHVDNSDQLLEASNTVLKSGGSMSLWVYGPRQGITLMINNALRGITTNMAHDDLLQFSRMIARGLRVFSHTPYRVLRPIPIVHSLVSHLPVHDHHKWPFDIVVADIYDRLRIPVCRWFTKEELERWYGNAGYADFTVQRIVRNNETFRSFGIKR
jgi:SAM-dependent methyltransferase